MDKNEFDLDMILTLNNLDLQITLIFQENFGKIQAYCGSCNRLKDVNKRWVGVRSAELEIQAVTMCTVLKRLH